MTEDVAVLRRAGRRGRGPRGRACRRQREGRDTGGPGGGPGARDRQLSGDAQAGARPAPRRPAYRSKLREGDMRELDAGRACGPDLLPVSRTPASPDLGRPAAGLRAESPPRSNQAGGSRGTRSRSTRTSPRRNDGVWAEQAGIRHRVDHVPAEARIDITLESADSISLWWLNALRVGRADRRRRARGGGSATAGSTGARSTSRARSSSGWRGKPG